jgi:hypothetical protein
MVMQVFRERDPRKIQAVMSQLLAFMPDIDLDGLRKKMKEEHDKTVSERAQNTGNEDEKPKA